MNKLNIQDELTEFLLYNDGNGSVKVETYLHNETLVATVSTNSSVIWRATPCYWQTFKK